MWLLIACKRINFKTNWIKRGETRLTFVVVVYVERSSIADVIFMITCVCVVDQVPFQFASCPSLNVSLPIWSLTVKEKPLLSLTAGARLTYPISVLQKNLLSKPSTVQFSGHFKFILTAHQMTWKYLLHLEPCFYRIVKKLFVSTELSKIYLLTLLVSTSFIGCKIKEFLYYSFR